MREDIMEKESLYSHELFQKGFLLFFPKLQSESASTIHSRSLFLYENALFFYSSFRTNETFYSHIFY